MTDVVLPTRLMKLMGAEVLFLTNASGGIKQGFSAGDFMMITGQISSFVPSPLIGANINELGTRFPDMSHIYDEDLQAVIRKAAVEHDIPLKEGVYIQLTGPNYESPQEINMCRVLGADAVGMEHCLRGGCGKSHGNEDLRYFLHFPIWRRESLPRLLPMRRYRRRRIELRRSLNGW